MMPRVEAKHVSYYRRWCALSSVVVLGVVVLGLVVTGIVHAIEGGRVVLFKLEYTWLKISSFLFGKLLVSVCYTGVITYTMELFPTSVRGTLLGVCALASSTGNMFAPLTPILNTVSVILPSMFFGGFAIISGALLTQTPETKDLPLMDTIEQVERSTKLQESRRRDISKKGEENYGFDNVAQKGDVC